MHVTILSPKHVVHESEAESVFLPGDRGEFEILPFHAPIISLLKAGNVIINWREKIPIKSGMVRFNRSECIVMVQE